MNKKLSKTLKWVGIVLGCLVGLIVLLAISLYALGNARLTKNYNFQPEAVAIPTDATSIQNGRHWADSYCAHCHGEDFSGKDLIKDKTIGYIPASNLTSGEGGAGGEFSDADWVRALRHGVDPEGRALIGMPSQNYYYMSDKDLGELIAYLKTVPPVDHDMGEPVMTFMGKVILAAGVFGENALSAESIDHSGVRPSTVEPGVNAQYGEYLVRLGGCRDCHGQDFSGGKSPAPGSPFAPNLTLSGPVGQWSKDVFINAVRTMKGKGMPWDELRPLTDPELEAIYLFLQSLPAMKDTSK